MIIMQVKSNAVELVSGHGVYCTQQQLDAALDGSRGSATRLIRNLISVFFKPEVLAVSSAMGIRNHPALDSAIVSACIREFH